RLPPLLPFGADLDGDGDPDGRGVGRPARLDLPAQPALRPAFPLRPRQPPLLLVPGESGDLRVVLQAQRVPPTGHRDVAGDPGVVAQGLVRQTRPGDGQALPAGEGLLAVDQPVAEPPCRRTVDHAYLVAYSAPCVERQVRRKRKADSAGPDGGIESEPVRRRI